MNEPFRPAQTLAEVARQATLEPLKPGDPRYVDLSKGPESLDLKLLRQYIEDQNANERRYALAAMFGLRGCGKTTGLFRLEHDLSARVTSIHLFVDEALLNDPDLDYADLMLWLVDQLAREFDRLGHRLDEGLLEDVVEWFASRTQEDVKTLRAEATAAIEAEASGKTGLYFVSLKMLARIKSMVQGSLDRRQIVRRELKHYRADLLWRINQILDDAARVLKRHGKSPDLLIVQDNLDRLKPETAERVFIENDDLLGKLNAHAIYTAPLALVLSATANLGQTFDRRYTIPMVQVLQKGGGNYRKGTDALLGLIAARADLEKVFTNRGVIRYLARMSGGSVRDLMRLLFEAQSLARADDKDRIDHASAKGAVQRIRRDLERTLWPYRALAQIHESNSLPEPESADRQPIESVRALYADLLLRGVVFEYGSDECWYDVHPMMRDIRAFKEALTRG